MRDTAREALKKGREISRQARQIAGNARDRLLDSRTLVQAEQTPYEVIHTEQDLVRLRYYPPLPQDSIAVAGERLTVKRTPYRTPLVLVAPLAVNMLIYDLFPDRSLVRYLLAQGFPLYLIDWGRPGADQDGLRLEDYFARMMPTLLRCVRAHSGQQDLSLHGWSLGGVFSLCHSALGDPNIRNLVLVGTPCDYHRNGALGVRYRFLSRQAQRLEKRAGIRLHRTTHRLWRSPGWANSLMFKLTNPVSSAQGYIDLLLNLHDREYVRNHATQGAFLDDMVAYPGASVQDMIQYFWIDNVLVNGALPMESTAHGIERVTSNLLLITGNDDPIVTEDCSMPILKRVQSQDRQHYRVPGGHMSILGGSQAPAEIWPQMVSWLGARSS